MQGTSNAGIRQSALSIRLHSRNLSIGAQTVGLLFVFGTAELWRSVVWPSAECRLPALRQRSVQRIQINALVFAFHDPFANLLRGFSFFGHLVGVEGFLHAR